VECCCTWKALTRSSTDCGSTTSTCSLSAFECWVRIKSMSGVREAYVLVMSTRCLDLCLFGVRIPTKGVLRWSFVLHGRTAPMQRVSQFKILFFFRNHTVGNSSLRCSRLTISIKSRSFSLVKKPYLTKKSSTTSAQFGLNSPFAMACRTSSIVHR
jgi:hypothetical protein